MNGIAERVSHQEPPLLAADEPPPFDLLNARGAGPFLLVCDHASRTVPRALGDLGLDEGALGGHIAWDIGAAEILGWTRGRSAAISPGTSAPPR
jgi:predicted N-formylglutamate amidohydrolase